MRKYADYLRVIWRLLLFSGYPKNRNGYRLRTQVLANITSFHQCTSALPVTSLCFWMPSEQLLALLE